MNHWILLTTLTLGVVGCDLGDDQTPTPLEPLSATFRLTDTCGHEVTSFRSGEDFDISLSVVNTTSRRLTVYRGDSSPDVIFRILQADTVVATSIDGYAFAQVATIGYIEPGQALEGRWRAPNTHAQNPRIVLIPESYRVQSFFPRFDEVEVKQVLPINFSITP